MKQIELKCYCYYCEGNISHPERHIKFERQSNMPSDELEPGLAVEFCITCGHERIVTA